MKDFSAVYKDAVAAGYAAAAKTVPVPMIVTDGIKTYAPVMGGVCGFAWVRFKGNSEFGRWAKKMGYAKKNYPTGLMIWISDFGQSMEKKEAYGYAFAEVLRANGIEAYASSRMD